MIGHLHLPLLSKLLDKIEYEDDGYMESLMKGRPVLGQIDANANSIPTPSPATRTLSDWAANPRERNEKIIRGMRPSADPRADEQAWEKMLKAVRRGYERGPFPISHYDLDAVCFTPRFPKWESKEDGSWTVRTITDLKRSGANETVSTPGKYAPEDLSHAWAVLRCLKGRHPSCRIQGYRADWETAFRQDPTSPDQTHLLVELQWCPSWRAPAAFESNGQPFGGKGTQFNFIRDPEAMVAIGRSWLGLVISNYSDDTYGLEYERHAHFAWKCWMELHALIGWRLDAGKSPPPSFCFRLLGADLDVGADPPKGKLPARKAAQYKSEVHAVLQKNTLTPAEASSLRGKLS